MSLTCDNCGAENLAINRYCGQCGTRLAPPPKPADDTPEEFWREPDQPQSHGEAVEGASATSKTSELDSLLRQDVSHEAGESARTDAGPVVAVSAAPQTGGDQPTNAGGEAASERHVAHTGVSGPSFLGLTDDDGSLDYAEDWDEPQSHLRRNLALVMLAVATVLVTLQWRSIRDYGVAYIQNGTRTIQREIKPAPTTQAELAATSSNHDAGAGNPVNASGSTPKAIENSPNAGHDLPVQESESQPAQTAAPPKQPGAMSAPNTDTRQTPSGPEQPQPSSTAQPRSAARAGTSRFARADEPIRGASGPGEDEMRRAAEASDPGDRATWLWRAVGKGNPEAPVQLATMYELGDGVVRSCDQARMLLRAAVSRGNEQAKLNLQQILREGCPVR